MPERVRFEMRVLSGNAALVENPIGEIKRLLKQQLDMLPEEGDYDELVSYSDLRDINGNSVGWAELEIE